MIAFLILIITFSTFENEAAASNSSILQVLRQSDKHVKRNNDKIPFLLFNQNDYKLINTIKNEETNSIFFHVSVKDSSKLNKYRIKELRCDFDKYITEHQIRNYHLEWTNATKYTKQPEILHRGQNINTFHSFQIINRPRLMCRLTIPVGLYNLDLERYKSTENYLITSDRLKEYFMVREYLYDF